MRRTTARIDMLILLPAFALLLLGGLWAAVFHQVTQERRIAHNETLAKSQALAHTFAEYSVHILRQADHASQLFKLQFEAKDGKLTLEDFIRKDGVMNSVLPTDIDTHMFLINKDGMKIESTQPFTPISVANEQYFKDHASRPIEVLTVNKPLIVAADGSKNRWLIQFTRRLNHVDGSFAGVLVFETDPAYFIDNYDTLDLGTQGVLILLSPLEKLSIHRVGEQVDASRKLEFTSVDNPDPNNRIDQLLLPIAFDGTPRLFSARALVEFSLMAVVGLTEDEALIKYDHRTHIYFAVAAIVTAIIAAFIALLMRQGQHLRASIRRAHDNHNFLKSLIDYLPVLVYAKSLHPDNFGQIKVWNQTAEIVTGYAEHEMVGKNSRQAFPPAIAAKHEEQNRNMLADPMVSDIPEETLLRPDGTLRYLHTVSVPLFDADDKPEYILSIAEDITERREQERQLRQKQAELAAVIDASPLGLISSDRTGQCTYVNRTFESISGILREKALGDGWMSALHPDDRGKLFQAMQALINTREAYQNILRFAHKDGKVVWASVKIAAILVDQRIEGYVGTVDDITLRRASELALRESEARLRTIANALPAMVAYFDADERHRFHNIAYERDFWPEAAQAHGKTVLEAVGHERYIFLEPYIQRVLAGESLVYLDETWTDDEYRCLETNYIPQLSQDGEHVVGFHVMRQDITPQKLEEMRLLQLAQVDVLTGLCNRAGFQLRLSNAMRHSRDAHTLMAVMFMDIDYFKPVNDTHGHKVGDALLQAFSYRLSHTFRSSDTVARFGGDEFVVIMDNLSAKEDAVTLAAKVVRAMQVAFDLGGITVSVSASIGLTYYQGCAKTAEELIHCADMMLYEAKRAGRNTFKVGDLA
jgi:diguanylate cyclase (GGDEF)-like protein/PAS domain S-box-containing protein